MWPYSGQPKADVESRPPRKPERTEQLEAAAIECCRKVGHVVHRGWCVICYTLQGDVTVEDAVPTADCAAE